MRTLPIVFHPEGLDLEAEVFLPEGARTLLILCHGIPSGSPPDPTDAGYPGLARDLAGHGYATAWFNFRGCRGAAGNFSMQGWCDDLTALLDHLRTTAAVAGLRQVVVGSSAGGSAAIVVAARRPEIAAVATLAAPASWWRDGLVEDPRSLLQRFRNIGIIRDPAFPADVDAWAKEFDETAAEASVARIAPRPLLLVHGDADDVVPYPHAETLFAEAGQPKELVRIPAGGHQLRRDPRAVDAVLDWLDHTA